MLDWQLITDTKSNISWKIYFELNSNSSFNLIELINSIIPNRNYFLQLAVRFSYRILRITGLRNVSFPFFGYSRVKGPHCGLRSIHSLFCTHFPQAIFSIISLRCFLFAKQFTALLLMLMLVTKTARKCLLSVRK